ncbi:iron-containing alcohol dehydrogenase [Paenibacillus dakarensis]|uniref:iron-containing alcohol dehydrogenase n=1 Tax=Paenibacillus dakarensis TaxID=1527293 RepID=UPI0006D53161|nr:iron-containing alcohol dehydrogenase [Paenibacillus dakarensis]
MNNFYHATRILEGNGTLKEVGNEAKLLGATKVMVVTDDFLSKTPVFSTLTKSLEDAGLSYMVYTNVKPNPRSEDCDAATVVAREENVDLIVAFGGGSAMDQAKAVAALLTNGKTCRDWDNVPLDHPMLPTICIPTTSGTGSEVTFVSVITDTERQFKMSIFDPQKLIPALAICDAEVTLGLPKSLTAACGIDALTHAIEAYTSKVAQPITDSLALTAISLISQNILKAYEDGSNLEARQNMMIGSTIAGIAFINSNVGAVHAISETIGGWFDTPHGVGNSIFLPYVMEFNVSANVKKFADVAVALGVEVTPEMTKEDIAAAGVKKVAELNKQLNIPALKDLSYITPEHFDAIAERSAKNMLSDDNARDITKEDYLDILNKAYTAGRVISYV